MNTPTIAVLGLGYVGLPLAVEFGKKFKTIGFDPDQKKITAYNNYIDPTEEVSTEDLKAAKHLSCSTDPSTISEADFIIIAVPTPVDDAKIPDLTPLESASETAGTHMKKGAIVVFESTVYPGATEEICVPVLETRSGMTWKNDFFVGYSPERINPGDKERTLTAITKVVSGDTEDTLENVRALYASIITAGVHTTRTIKEAEAAKVIENTQRDVNISLVNELALLFDQMEIDTLNVLEAAGTKWNFLPFRPGLVGGHCIGVDPYYLTYKAQTLGYHPQVILSGRRINDGMGKFIAEKTVKEMIASGRNVRETKVGILGLTFKEDCPDLRNTRIVDTIRELESYEVEVLVHDPLADKEEVMEEYGFETVSWEALSDLDAVILAVGHSEYKMMSTDQLLSPLSEGGCIIDVKSTLDPDAVEPLPYRFWRL